MKFYLKIKLIIILFDLGVADFKTLYGSWVINSISFDIQPLKFLAFIE